MKGWIEMSYTMFKFFYDYEKEEKWLNKMSSNGKALTNYFWTKYTFEDEESGKYIYKIEFLDKSGRSDLQNDEYLRFLDDVGVECVGVYMHWAILRKEAATGDFELYTDWDSKIRLSNKMWNWWLKIAILEIAITSYLIINYLFFPEYKNTFHFCFMLLIIMFDTVFVRLALRSRKRMKEFMKEKEIYEN